MGDVLEERLSVLEALVADQAAQITQLKRQKGVKHLLPAAGSSDTMDTTLRPPKLRAHHMIDRSETMYAAQGLVGELPRMEEKHHEFEDTEWMDKDAGYSFVRSLWEVDTMVAPPKDFKAVKVFRWFYALTGFGCPHDHVAAKMAAVHRYLYHFCAIAVWVFWLWAAYYDDDSGPFFSQAFEPTCQVVAYFGASMLGSQITQYDRVGTAIAQMTRNTSRRSAMKERIAKSLLFTIVVALCITVIGGFSNFFRAREVLTDANLKPVRDHLGVAAIRAWQVFGFMAFLHFSAGFSMFCLLMLLHRIRVISSFRRLSRPGCSVMHAILRVVDLDICLGHFGHKLTVYAIMAFIAYFFSFVFSAISLIRADPTSKNLTAASFTTSAALGGLLMPAFVCLYLLVCIGLLNKDCDFHNLVCARFIISHKAQQLNLQGAVEIDEKPKKKKGGKEPGLKEFKEYYNSADLCYRVYGYKFGMAAPWKMAGILISIWVTMLRLKQKRIL